MNSNVQKYLSDNCCGSKIEFYYNLQSMVDFLKSMGYKYFYLRKTFRWHVGDITELVVSEKQHKEDENGYLIYDENDESVNDIIYLSTVQNKFAELFGKRLLEISMNHERDLGENEI